MPTFSIEEFAELVSSALEGRKSEQTPLDFKLTSVDDVRYNNPPLTRPRRSMSTVDLGTNCLPTSRQPPANKGLFSKLKRQLSRNPKSTPTPAAAPASGTFPPLPTVTFAPDPEYRSVTSFGTERAPSISGVSVLSSPSAYSCASYVGSTTSFDLAVDHDAEHARPTETHSILSSNLSLMSEESDYIPYIPLIMQHERLTKQLPLPLPVPLAQNGSTLTLPKTSTASASVASLGISSIALSHRSSLASTKQQQQKKGSVSRSSSSRKSRKSRHEKETLAPPALPLHHTRSFDSAHRKKSVPESKRFSTSSTSDTDTKSPVTPQTPSFAVTSPKTRVTSFSFSDGGDALSAVSNGSYMEATWSKNHKIVTQEELVFPGTQSSAMPTTREDRVTSPPRSPPPSGPLPRTPTKQGQTQEQRISVTSVTSAFSSNSSLQSSPSSPSDNGPFISPASPSSPRNKVSSQTLSLRPEQATPLLTPQPSTEWGQRHRHPSPFLDDIHDISPSREEDEVQELPSPLLSKSVNVGELSDLELSSSSPSKPQSKLKPKKSSLKPSERLDVARQQVEKPPSTLTDLEWTLKLGLPRDRERAIGTVTEGGVEPMARLRTKSESALRSLEPSRKPSVSLSKGPGAESGMSKVDSSTSKGKVSNDKLSPSEKNIASSTLSPPLPSANGSFRTAKASVTKRSSTTSVNDDWTLALPLPSLRDRERARRISEVGGASASATQAGASIVGGVQPAQLKKPEEKVGVVDHLEGRRTKVGQDDTKSKSRMSGVTIRVEDMDDTVGQEEVVGSESDVPQEDHFLLGEEVEQEEEEEEADDVLRVPRLVAGTGSLSRSSLRKASRRPSLPTILSPSDSPLDLSDTENDTEAPFALPTRSQDRQTNCIPSITYSEGVDAILDVTVDCRERARIQENMARLAALDEDLAKFNALLRSAGKEAREGAVPSRRRVQSSVGLGGSRGDGVKHARSCGFFDYHSGKVDEDVEDVEMKGRRRKGTMPSPLRRVSTKRRPTVEITEEEEQVVIHEDLLVPFDGTLPSPQGAVLRTLSSDVVFEVKPHFPPLPEPNPSYPQPPSRSRSSSEATIRSSETITTDETFPSAGCALPEIENTIDTGEADVLMPKPLAHPFVAAGFAPSVSTSATISPPSSPPPSNQHINATPSIAGTGSVASRASQQKIRAPLPFSPVKPTAQAPPSFLNGSVTGFCPSAAVAFPRAGKGRTMNLGSAVPATESQSGIDRVRTNSSIASFKPTTNGQPSLTVFTQAPHPMPVADPKPSAPPPSNDSDSPAPTPSQSRPMPQKQTSFLSINTSLAAEDHRTSFLSISSSSSLTPTAESSSTSLLVFHENEHELDSAMPTPLASNFPTPPPLPLSLSEETESLLLELGVQRESLENVSRSGTPSGSPRDSNGSKIGHVTHVDYQPPSTASSSGSSSSIGTVVPPLPQRAPGMVLVGHGRFGSGDGYRFGMNMNGRGSVESGPFEEENSSLCSGTYYSARSSFSD